MPKVRTDEPTCCHSRSVSRVEQQSSFVVKTEAPPGPVGSVEASRVEVPEGRVSVAAVQGDVAEDEIIRNKAVELLY